MNDINDSTRQLRETGLRQQLESEKRLVKRALGSSKDIRALDKLDTLHLMNAVSMVGSWGPKSESVATASLISGDLYNAARRGYDWRDNSEEPRSPEVAVYLDCIARFEELAKGVGGQ